MVQNHQVMVLIVTKLFLKMVLACPIGHKNSLQAAFN